MATLCSLVYWISSKWSDPYVQYFIRNEKCALNFTAIRYSLCKCSETILC